VATELPYADATRIDTDFDKGVTMTVLIRVNPHGIRGA